MRICVVSYSFYEFDNRVQRYAETLARHGHAVEVFARRAGGSPPFATVNRVNVRRIQESSLNEPGRMHFFFHLSSFILRSAFLVAREHWRRPFDLVHAHSPPDFIVCAAVFPRILGVPIILDIHDLGPELYAARFKAGQPSVAFKALLAVEKICCRFASHVIIANDLWRTRLLSRSVKADRCAAILNYPDPRLFHQFRPKRAGSRFVLMYPGTMSWHQGLDIAIGGMKIIARAREDVDLHIYGDGSSEAELRNLVKKLKLENRVWFRGRGF